MTCRQRRRAAISHAEVFRSRAQAGFTLLEISLVLLIFGIVLSFVIPRLRDPSQLELSSNVRRLALKVRFLRGEAILNGRIYRLNFDLDGQRYWISTEDTVDDTANGDTGSGSGLTGSGSGLADSQSGGLALPQDFDPTDPIGRPVTLPETVAFSDVVLQGVGKLSQGQVYTRFFPDGTVDPTVVHMDNGRQAYTLVIWPFTGKVSRFEGYRDVTQTQG